MTVVTGRARRQLARVRRVNMAVVPPTLVAWLHREAGGACMPVTTIRMA